MYKIGQQRPTRAYALGGMLHSFSTIKLLRLAFFTLKSNNKVQQGLHKQLSILSFR